MVRFILNISIIKKYLKLKGLHKLLDGFEDKTAYAMCIIAFGEPGKEIKLFVGKADGRIVEPRGPPHNFGWTPCFEPIGYDQTYGEMDKALKNKISHRYKAVDTLKKYLINNK